MKNKFLLLLLIVLTSFSFAITKESIEKQKSDFEASKKNFVNESISAAKPYVYKMVFAKVTKMLLKRGIVVNASTLEKIIENENAFYGALDYVENLVKKDGILLDAGIDFFKAYADSQMIALVQTLIPGANVCYIALKTYQALIDDLNSHIYASNTKTFISLFLKDPNIWNLKGKQRVDYFLQSYLQINPETMYVKPTSAMNNVTKMRGFFIAHGNEITKGGQMNKDVMGWEEKSWLSSDRKSLLQQRTAISFVFRDFLLRQVLPIKKSQEEAKKKQEELKQQVVLIKKVMSQELSKSRLESQFKSQASTLVAEWEKKESKILNLNIERDTQILSNQGKKSPKTNPPEKASNEYYDRKQAAYDIRVKQIQTVSKKIATWKKDKRLRGITLPSPESLTRLKLLNADAYIQNRISNIANNRNLFSAWINKIDFNDASKQQMISTIEKYEENLDENNDELNDMIITLEDGIRAMESFYSEVSAVSYVGLTGLDASIKHKKDSVMASLLYTIAHYKKLKDKNEAEEDYYREYQDEADDAMDNVLDYAQALDRYNSKIEPSIATNKKLNDFGSGKIDSLTALSSQRDQWQGLVENHFRSLKSFFEVFNEPFPIDEGDLDLKKSDTGFLDRQYERYFQRQLSIYIERIEKDKEMKILGHKLKAVPYAGTVKALEYPVFENRSFYMSQTDVNNARKLIEDTFKEIEKNAGKDKSLIQAYQRKWMAYKKGLLALWGTYISQQCFTKYSPEKTIKPIMKKYAGFLSGYLSMIEKYDKAVKEYKKKLVKAKSRAKKVDAEEKKRFFKEFSRRKIMTLSQIINIQRFALTDFRQAKRYFPIYLATDIGKAKTLYLYLFSKMNDISKTDADAKQLYSSSAYTAQDKQTARQLFSKELDVYLEMKAILRRLEKDLKTKTTDVSKLKDHVSSIDTTKPIEDIINGRLDSDGDGISDSEELAKGTDPANGDDGDDSGFITGTRTLSGSGGFNISTGQPEGWSASKGQIFWTSSQIETANGYVDITSTRVTPSSGYDTGSSNNINPIQGRLYALYWNGGYYGKIEILSISGSTLQFKYWYKIAGGTF